MRILPLVSLVAIATTMAFMQPAPSDAQGQPRSGMQTLPCGLQYQDLVVGNGPVARPGNTVQVHYTGWLMNGQKFDSSLDRGQPFDFQIGAHQVIQGWEQGVPGMRVGGKRVLVIPAALGYGVRGMPPVIPGNATLKFEVQLLGVH